MGSFLSLQKEYTSGPNSEVFWEVYDGAGEWRPLSVSLCLGFVTLPFKHSVTITAEIEEQKGVGPFDIQFWFVFIFFDHMQLKISKLQNNNKYRK